MKEITFKEYLKQLVDDGISYVTDGVAADFALDAVADNTFPEDVKADAEGFFKMMNYLYYCEHVDHYVIDAFMECWESFEEAAESEETSGDEEAYFIPAVDPNTLTDLIDTFVNLDIERREQAVCVMKALLEDQMEKLRVRQ